MRGATAKEAFGLIAVLAGLIATLWALPALVTLAHARALPAMDAGEAVAGTVTIAAKGHWSEPRGAYPSRARETMPAGRSWWLAAATPLALIAAVSALLVRPADVATARRRLGRRGYDPRGARPREWARPRDLRALVIARRSGERMTLGSLDGRLLAADPEAMVALCAPPRAGKTTGCVIPWLLEHDGPALVTSSKRDVILHW